ncbi:ATP-binding cassette sub-family A member 1-like, partial [Tachysurus ichikawai]
MPVSTQLGLLLWKNFTYRRRQTVSWTRTCVI